MSDPTLSAYLSLAEAPARSSGRPQLPAFQRLAGLACSKISPRAAAVLSSEAQRQWALASEMALGALERLGGHLPFFEFHAHDERPAGAFLERAFCRLFGTPSERAALPHWPSGISSANGFFRWDAKQPFSGPALAWGSSQDRGESDFAAAMARSLLATDAHLSASQASLRARAFVVAHEWGHAFLFERGHPLSASISDALERSGHPMAKQSRQHTQAFASRDLSSFPDSHSVRIFHLLLDESFCDALGSLCLLSLGHRDPLGAIRHCREAHFELPDRAARSSICYDTGSLASLAVESIPPHELGVNRLLAACSERWAPLAPSLLDAMGAFIATIPLGAYLTPPSRDETPAASEPPAFLRRSPHSR